MFVLYQRLPFHFGIEARFPSSLLRLGLALVTCLAGQFGATAVSGADDAHNMAAAATNTPAETELVESQQAEVRRRLQRLQAEFDRRDDDRIAHEVRKELDTLTWLNLTYSEQLELRSQLTAAHQELQQAKTDLEAVRNFGIEGETPYSYLRLDEVRSERNSLVSRLATMESLQQSNQQSRGEFKEELRQLQISRRQVDEALSDAGTRANLSPLQRERQLSMLLIQAHEAALDHLEAESGLRAIEIETLQTRIETATEKERLMAANFRFSEEDLELQLSLLAQIQNQLHEDMSAKMLELANLQRATPDGSSDERQSVPIDQLRSKLFQQELDQCRQVLRLLVETRVAWRWRYQVVNQTVSVAELHDWNTKSKNAVVRADALHEELTDRVQELRDQIIQKRKLGLQTAARIQTTTNRPGSQPAPALPAPDEGPMLAELDRSAATLSQYVNLVDAGRQLFQRTNREIEVAIEPSNGQSALASIGYWAARVWNCEVAVVEDRSITVGKILIAIALLLGGLVLARLLSRTLGTKLLPRLGVNESAAAALQSIAFYLMVCCFSIVVLELVNVPITGLAFMGGAIAIGVGFGSQNIINNFISGLILLAERPIRPGDLVEIDGLSANIQHIARAARA